MADSDNDGLEAAQADSDQDQQQQKNPKHFKMPKKARRGKRGKKSQQHQPQSQNPSQAERNSNTVAPQLQITANYRPKHRGPQTGISAYDTVADTVLALQEGLQAAKPRKGGWSLEALSALKERVGNKVSLLASILDISNVAGPVSMHMQLGSKSCASCCTSMSPTQVLGSFMLATQGLSEGLIYRRLNC